MLNDAIDGGEVAIVFASSDIGPLDGSNATTGKARGADARKARRGGAGERSGVVRKRLFTQPHVSRGNVQAQCTGAMYGRNVTWAHEGTTALSKNSKKWF